MVYGITLNSWTVVAIMCSCAKTDPEELLGFTPFGLALDWAC
jgi:hypothetical protein